jgi:hypothetical protein
MNGSELFVFGLLLGSIIGAAAAGVLLAGRSKDPAPKVERLPPVVGPADTFVICTERNLEAEQLEHLARTFEDGAWRGKNIFLPAGLYVGAVLRNTAPGDAIEGGF